MATKKATAKKVNRKKTSAINKPTQRGVLSPDPGGLSVETEDDAGNLANAEAFLDKEVKSSSELPSPEELQQAEARLQDDSGLSVSSLPPATIPLGVSEEEVATVFTSPAAPIQDVEENVRIRALVSLDANPTIGVFSFSDAIGKDSMTGSIVRGEFRDGYIYVVPRYVAIMCAERRWAMAV